MNADDLLRDLDRRGVRLEAHGRDLIVDGPAEALPDRLIERLRVLKGELLAVLAGLPVEQPEGSAEWRGYFEERAAIREYDGGLPRADAERFAIEDAITRWLCLNPVPVSAPSGCIYCSRGEQASNMLIPVLAARGHVWVHDRCWEAWRAERRTKAETVLRQIGLPISETGVVPEPVQ